MISYKRIDKIEFIDFNKGEILGNLHSVECMICHYCYFKGGFKYQSYVCNACQDFGMSVQNLSDFLIVTIKTVDYRIYVTGVDKEQLFLF